MILPFKAWILEPCNLTPVFFCHILGVAHWFADGSFSVFLWDGERGWSRKNPHEDALGRKVLQPPQHGLQKEAEGGPKHVTMENNLVDLQCWESGESGKAQGPEGGG